MLRKDYLKPHWKEKFIASLPPLFANEVQEELTDKNGTINYEHMVIFLALLKNLVLTCVMIKKC